MNIESTSLWIGLALLCSCQSRQQVTAPVSTIDSTLQTNATAILESKLSEINAQSGQVIIMEVQSGQIKALVGLTRKDSTNYQSCENFSVWPKIEIAHKTGEDTNISHDVGIVFSKEPFILCFCGNNVDVTHYERLIQDMTYDLYKYNIKE